MGIISDAITTATSSILTTNPYRCAYWLLFGRFYRLEQKPEEWPEHRITLMATNEEIELLCNEASAGFMASDCDLVIISYFAVTVLNWFSATDQGRCLTTVF